MISDPRRTRATAVASLDIAEQPARRVAALIAESFAADELAVSFVDKGGGRWRVTIYFGTTPDKKTVRALVTAAAGPEAARTIRFAHVVAKDWVGASLSGLRPIEVGRFVIHGAHDRAGIVPNRIAIEIEAALAFGTGHHGTTRGCLEALDRICKSRGSRMSTRILDLGTGSGILAIGAARALRQRVLATDIDAQAVRVARGNARLNRVGPLIEVVRADGVTSKSVRARGRFDLIFANILLAPLQRLAAPLTRLAVPGGRVVLSGLLSSQANAALAAYHALTLERRIALDGWTTLVMRRPGC
jgi:ribosomal protein L11 methyltransferase